MSQLFAGFVLGLGLIVPIGSQNLYVLNQSLRLGLPRSLAVASAAAVCDIVLITVGSAGASVVLQRSQWLRLGLLVAGALFLAFLSVRSWRVPVGASGNAAGTAAPASQESVLRVVLTACSVSLLNPHAIIDTVGVIGAAVASAGEQALQFATGAGIASVVWFSGIAVSASLLSGRLTDVTIRRINRVSALVLFGFALRLAWEAVKTVGW